MDIIHKNSGFQNFRKINIKFDRKKRYLHFESAREMRISHEEKVTFSFVRESEVHSHLTFVEFLVLLHEETTNVENENE